MSSTMNHMVRNFYPMNRYFIIADIWPNEKAPLIEIMADKSQS